MPKDLPGRHSETPVAIALSGPNFWGHGHFFRAHTNFHNENQRASR